ncbi:MAG: DNA polymerase III subunit gamma/tau [Trueperaceae bacterium]
MAAIYQSARPATFAEVVGQDHVKDVLLAALQRGRASHAYLFSGPRGVGKTTTARLLAMALNCEADAASVRPCGSCDGCRMVREGHHPDVIELDAASNNSVDDVRELREKTNLASMRGGSRVWILDEAHMLSRPAANALLKTLEEPPPGLVFILATTEPEKLPPTVLSRCQHFRFRRLAEAEILGKLERLCREAVVEAETEALALVARAADGAMRDAESLLERLLTPGSTITLASAEEALGLPPVHRMQRLATALAEADLASLLSEAEALYRDGFAPRSLAENLGTVLRDALRTDVIGADVIRADVIRADVVGADVAGAPAAFRLPLERAALMRLIHALDDEQDRFIRRDDLYSLEVALIKGVNSLTTSAGGGTTTEAAQSAGHAEQAATRQAPGQSAPARQTGARQAEPRQAAVGQAAVGPAEAKQAAEGSAQARKADAEPVPAREAGAVRQPATPEPARHKAQPARHKAQKVPQQPTADASAQPGELPSFDPTGRAPNPAAKPAAKPAARPSASEQAADTKGASGGEASGDAPRKRLDWHKVRSAAGPQLKAFLMPARESVEGTDVTIRYAEMHKFHFTELKKRESELARLIEEIGGPGYRLRIEGPGEDTAKKS